MTGSASGPSASAFTLPAALRPGDLVAVVAPSSPFEPTPCWVGLGWLARRYRVRFDRGLFARTGYLAGDDDRRRGELTRALGDPEVSAILAARGGYGLSRFAHEIDWAGVAKSPRWIVGFSDITAVHVELARVGVASIHGCHVTALGRADARARDGLVALLEDPTAARTWSSLRTLAPGSATGPLFGGNLALLQACAAAGRLVVPEGAVLLLEDVSERPYRIDRMLSTLEAGGHLARASAIVLGEFVDCHPGPDGVVVEAVLEERLSRLGIPVVAGAPIGHGRINEPVVFGGPCIVDARPHAATVRTGKSSEV